jgi:hypothetical protein
LPRNLESATAACIVDQYNFVGCIESILLHTGPYLWTIGAQRELQRRYGLRSLRSDAAIAIGYRARSPAEISPTMAVAFGVRVCRIESLCV